MKRLLKLLGFGPTLVRFDDGMWGVRSSRIPFVAFYGRDGTEWSSMGAVDKYCKCATREEAEFLRDSLPFRYTVVKD